jgi:2-haloacid dehalogenase
VAIGARAVTFDLGGVLIDWDPRYLYRQLLASEEEVERFLAEICTPAWNEEQDAGRPVTEAIAERCALFPEHRALIRAYYDRFPEMIAGMLEDNLTLVRELAARRVPLFALTNWSADTFSIVGETTELLDLFDGVLVSGRVGLKKPDPRIYRRFLSDFDLEAADVLFIDDREENARAAESVGMAAIWYRRGTDLRAPVLAWLES